MLTASQTTLAISFQTQLGWFALTAEADPSPLLRALVFGADSEPSALRRLLSQNVADDVADGKPPAYLQGWVDLFARYASGECVSMDGVPVASDHLTDFGRRVAAACRTIPYGATRSYGELAKAAGRPGAARAVGTVMAKNRTPLVVPCHRVLGAGGKLGGYSAPQGLGMKRRLLAMEAVHLGDIDAPPVSP